LTKGEVTPNDLHCTSNWTPMHVSNRLFLHFLENSINELTIV
jgi:hypothetical protein